MIDHFGDIPGTITDDLIERGATSLVMDRMKHFEDLRRTTGLYDRWDNNEKAWNNNMDDFYDGRSKVSVPEIHKAIERIVPKYIRALFPDDGNWLEATAKDIHDDISKEDAEVVTLLIKQQFHDAKARTKITSIARSCVIYGTVFAETTYDKRVKKRRRTVAGEKIVKEVTVFDGPDFNELPIRDVFVDPKDENLEDDVIIRKIVNYQDLWDLRKDEDDPESQGIYPTEQVKKLRQIRFLQERESEKRQEEDNKGLGGHRYGPNDHKIELLTFYGNVPEWMLTEDTEDFENGTIVRDALIEVAAIGDKAVLLRIDYNPNDHQEKPLVKASYIKVSGSIYGLGAADVNIPLQKELNTLRNQLMDMRTFTLRRKTLVDRNANVSEQQLKDLNKLIIFTDDINGVRDYVPVDFSGSAVPQGIQIQGDIQEGTGVVPLLGGTPQGNSIERTAEGVNTIVSGALERFELVIREFEENFMQELVKKFWQYNQQFLPDGKDVAIIGDEIIRVMPSKIPVEGLTLNFRGVSEFIKKAFMINTGNILIQNIIPFAEFGIDPTPILFKQVKLMGWSEIIPEIDKRPQAQLEQSPEGEVQLLRSGLPVRVDFDDDHIAFLRAYESILEQPILIDPEVDLQAYVGEFQTRIRSAKVGTNIKTNLIRAIGNRVKAITLDAQGAKSKHEIKPTE